MEIVKKNILSIIAGVIALLAILFYFWPRTSIQQQAQNALDARIAVAGKLQTLGKRTFNMPDVSITKNAQPTPLALFPSEPVVDRGMQLIQNFAAEAKAVEAAALDINRRKLLVDYSLPEPQGTTDYKFREVYLKAMANFAAEMKAGTPPTADEIKRATDELWNTKYAPTISMVGDKPDPLSQQRVDAAFREEAATLPDQLKSRKARELLVYMDVNALERSAAITPTGAPPSPSAIWYAQLHYWIQKDIAQAIIDTNGPFGSVLSAPVKNLLKLSIAPYRTTAGSVGAVPVAAPTDQPTDGTTPTIDINAPVYGASMTGRVCNPIFDVIPISLAVHIEADGVPLFLQELSSNRLITPYHVSMQPIDAVALGNSLNVVYGSAPIVQANISCEVLMLRKWTLLYMPPAVMRQLGATPLPPANP
jgi:hypothetical protein